MDIIPLPNNDSDPSDSGSVNPLDELMSGIDEDEVVNYVIRLTTCQKYAFEDVIEFFKKEFVVTRFVAGLEEDHTDNEHVHLVVTVDKSLSELDIRDLVRNFLQRYFINPLTGKFVQGFGNKHYNLKLCRDLPKAISYACKQKKYHNECFDVTFVEDCVARSFTKNKPSDFKNKYRELCTTFQDSDMSIREFMTRFVLLKSEFGQQVQLNVAYGYALSNEIKRDNTAAGEYVDAFLEKYH